MPATAFERASAAGLKLRPAQPGDTAFLSRLYASTRIDELVVVPWSAEQKRAFLAQQFVARNSYYESHYPKAQKWIVEHGETAAGCLHVGAGEHEIIVIDIALLPEARGKGFGTALLRDVIEAAHAQGHAVGIHVERMNPALALYHWLGFRLVEDMGVYLRLRCGNEPA